MQRTTTRRLIAVFALLAAAHGCGTPFIAKDVPLEPERTVKVVIRGVPVESGAPHMSDAERIRRNLVDLVADSPDGSYSVRSSGCAGGVYTLHVYPVDDPAAFAQQIRFGEATVVADRTIEVRYRPVESAGG